MNFSRKQHVRDYVTDSPPLPSEPQSLGAPNDLPNWLSHGASPLMLICLVEAWLINDDLAAAILAKESGIVEHGTVVILLPGILAGLSISFQGKLQGSRTLSFYIRLWTLAAIYFAGEEISWGQQWFGWETPEPLREINDQGETNLHNISSWLDQKPRALVEAWIIITGFVWPLIQMIKGKVSSPSRLHWYLPTRALLTTSAIVLLLWLSEQLIEVTGATTLKLFGSDELKEYYTAVFVALFLMSARCRIKSGLATLDAANESTV
ncbi:MAG: hypothetical protein CMJ78_12885 [Planctomycetaceae bacterium]|nr:hypothetical protein [Planctomycetaceae bacterium]